DYYCWLFYSGAFIF
nr:immunoglobulin light chain junction region [Macaca mulatta]